MVFSPAKWRRGEVRGTIQYSEAFCKDCSLAALFNSSVKHTCNSYCTAVIDVNEDVTNSYMTSLFKNGLVPEIDTKSIIIDYESFCYTL